MQKMHFYCLLEFWVNLGACWLPKCEPCWGLYKPQNSKTWDTFSFEPKHLTTWVRGVLGLSMSPCTCDIFSLIIHCLSLIVRGVVIKMTRVSKRCIWVLVRSSATSLAGVIGEVECHRRSDTHWLENNHWFAMNPPSTSWVGSSYCCGMHNLLALLPRRGCALQAMDSCTGHPGILLVYICFV